MKKLANLNSNQSKLAQEAASSAALEMQSKIVKHRRSVSDGNDPPLFKFNQHGIPQGHPVGHQQVFTEETDLHGN